MFPLLGRSGLGMLPALSARFPARGWCPEGSLPDGRAPGTQQAIAPTRSGDGRGESALPALPVFPGVPGSAADPGNTLSENQSITLGRGSSREVLGFGTVFAESL